MDADPQVRCARADEVVALDELRLAVWRTAYRRLLPGRFLDGLEVTAELTARRRHQLAHPDYALQVAVAGGALVGMAAAGPPADELDPAAVTEVGALYVLPERSGQGLGTALLEAVVLRRPRPRQSLWVLEGNAPALRFYAARGFTPDGARRTEDLGEPVEEVRLTRGS